MNCPECNEPMEQICMSGTDEEINLEFHCPKCQTLARLAWNPGKQVKAVPDGLPY